uniref:Uncharacterized protein n=1 Tax=Anguilla anguilla TaxID=7936 RepID=A0A0E9RVY8_ANGAN
MLYLILNNCSRFIYKLILNCAVKVSSVATRTVPCETSLRFLYLRANWREVFLVLIIYNTKEPAMFVSHFWFLLVADLLSTVGRRNARNVTQTPSYIF